MDLKKLVENKVLIFDGAMGTMLQNRGMPSGAATAMMNLEMPDTVAGIHADYVDAGAQVVLTNTFQAHEWNLSGVSVENVASAAVDCARASGAQYIALETGPIRKTLGPSGDLSFEQAYEAYRRLMLAGESAGADCILIATMFDLLEAKAAVRAAKQNTGLPAICTMTFGEDGRTFLGCDPVRAVLTLESLGVDALGANCSAGPDMLLPVVEQMLRHTTLPLLVKPNAGLPVMQGGRAIYELTPDNFARKMEQMADMGISMLGGCCGTTPAHIRALAQRVGGRKTAKHPPKSISVKTPRFGIGATASVARN